MNTTDYKCRLDENDCGGRRTEHLAPSFDAYRLSGARRNRKEGGFPTVLRPSFAIREIRDTRLLSVERGGGMANVAHAPNVRLLIYSKPCRGLCCAD